MSQERINLPDPVEQILPWYKVKEPGWWLILANTHIPYHDVKTIELAIREAKKQNVRGVLLNGDILDHHELSVFDKSPDDPRYIEEITAGRQFLAWIRHQLPKARIIYKEGNHEERLYSYLFRKAPALFGLDVLTLPTLLKLHDFDIEHIGDKKVIELGKLHVIHGHEYRPTIQVPVNPARGLFLRSKGSAVCGHFHQTSEHHEPTIGGKPLGCWSIGCACGLAPLYQPLNRWNLGFALVEISNTGDFSVRNMRVMNGEVV